MEGQAHTSEGNQHQLQNPAALLANGHRGLASERSGDLSEYWRLGFFGSLLVRESEAGLAGCRFVCKVLLWGHGAGLAAGQNRLYGVCKHICLYPTFRHISV